MANGFSDYVRSKVLDHIFGTSTMTKPTALYLALTTTSSTSSTPGTEPTTGTWYARKPLGFLDISIPNNTVTNTALVDFGVVNGAPITIIGCAIFDAPTGGNLLAYGDFTLTQTASPGNDIVVIPGAVAITLV